jgi:hypothetical protein
VVDVYNVTDGLWTTANLSIPRADIAAISAVGKVAIFAGGTDRYNLPNSRVDIYNVTDC